MHLSIENFPRKQFFLDEAGPIPLSLVYNFLDYKEKFQLVKTSSYIKNIILSLPLAIPKTIYNFDSLFLFLKRNSKIRLLSLKFYLSEDPDKIEKFIKLTPFLSKIICLDLQSEPTPLEQTWFASLTGLHKLSLTRDALNISLLKYSPLLEELTVRSSFISSSCDISSQDHYQLSSLRELTLVNCRSSISLQSFTPSTLKVLILEEFYSTSNEFTICDFYDLEVLHLARCQLVTNFSNLDKLKEFHLYQGYLHNLRFLSDCKKLERIKLVDVDSNIITILNKCTSLKEISLFMDKQTMKISPLLTSSLVKLELVLCEINIPVFPPSLTELRLVATQTITGKLVFVNPSILTRLCLNTGDKTKISYAGRTDLISLTTLQLKNCHFENNDFLAKSTNLNKIITSYFPADQVEIFTFFPNLTKLDFFDSDVACLYFLRNCFNLKRLTLIGNKALGNVRAISRLSKLETLVIRDSTFITDIYTLNWCTNLKSLTLRDCAISDLSDFVHYQNLTYLKIKQDFSYVGQSCFKGETLSSLLGCYNLNTLILKGIPNLTGVDELAHFTQLKLAIIFLQKDVDLNKLKTYPHLAKINIKEVDGRYAILL
jgi:hypothetical protein